MFTGSLFAILLIYIREDAIEARKAIYGIVIVNIGMSILFIVFSRHMQLQGTLNFIDLPIEIFQQSVRIALSGTFTLFLDVLLIIFLFEAIRPVIPKSPFLRIFITISAICTFDTVTFATLAFYGHENYLAIVSSGVAGKIGVSVYYSIFLATYLRLVPLQYEQTQTTLKDVFYLLTYRDRYEIEHLRAEQNEHLLMTAIQQSPIGVIIADAPNINIRFSSISGLKMRGGDSDHLTDVSLDQLAENWQIYTPDGILYNPEELQLYRAIQKGETIQGELAIIKDVAGNDHWVRINAAPVKNTKGEIISGVIYFDDITALKKIEAELLQYHKKLEQQVAARTADLKRSNSMLKKEIADRIILEDELRKNTESQRVLVREVNHRVKNNLSAIIGIIYKEQERASNLNHSVTRDVLDDFIHRIESLAAAHSLLSDSGWKPLKISDICAKIIYLVFQGVSRNTSVSFSIQESEIVIDADQAHNLTLVVNELATNTLKHALINQKDYIVSMTFDSSPSHIYVRYTDNWPGYPEEMTQDNYSECSIGFEILRGIIVESLRGDFELSNSGGAVFSFSIAQTSGNKETMKESKLP
jgi:PAS domain S-box-containing protein